MTVIKLAARNLTRRPARIVLTILGVSVAISFTVGILSISEGFMASFNLLPTLTALENVIFPMSVARIGSASAEHRAKELLSWVGLSHRLRHYPRQLSAGENQRVAIARALANQPLLLLADEPTGNLDSKSSQEIATLLKRINTEYKTAILLVTHDPGIGEIADKVFRMIDGRISIEEEQSQRQGGE